ncbi:hypothetical protein ALC57_00969 [Trachymyrmex cornetzi]|uniref:Uncharacterized protein n=1 Tax=Trachymyrmex cornetzi TaxID=471704 RepID=A0A195ENI5_9HYME|nr:hypothetical protein ALC57_00969 [Trachymyrmex cornetzi]
MEKLAWFARTGLHALYLLGGDERRDVRGDRRRVHLRMTTGKMKKLAGSLSTTGGVPSAVRFAESVNRFRGYTFPLSTKEIDLRAHRQVVVVALFRHRTSGFNAARCDAENRMGRS